MSCSTSKENKTVHTLRSLGPRKAHPDDLVSVGKEASRLSPPFLARKGSEKYGQPG